MAGRGRGGQEKSEKEGRKIEEEIKRREKDKRKGKEPGKRRERESFEGREIGNEEMGG